jgi:transposase-like protein
MTIVPHPPGVTMERMPSSPHVICLGDAERAELESLSRRASVPFRLVLRSRIALLSAAGTANQLIAERLGICQDIARKWRRRYCEQGIEGLSDAPRPGRPRVFPARVVAGVKALACEMPVASGTPLARWTCPELARHAAASGIAPAPSASTVRRWLAGDALKPWQPGRPRLAPGHPITTRQSAFSAIPVGRICSCRHVIFRIVELIFR